LPAFPAFHIAPPLPFVPVGRVGETFCAAIAHWAGPLEAGEKAMEPFRGVAPVAAEMTGPMPNPALNSAFDALYPAKVKDNYRGNFQRLTEINGRYGDLFRLNQNIPPVT